MNDYREYFNNKTKEERFATTIKILEDNNINYSIQKVTNNESLGNIIVEFNHVENDEVMVIYTSNISIGMLGDEISCSLLMNLILSFKDTDKHLQFVFFYQYDIEKNQYGGYTEMGGNYYANSSKNKIAYAIGIELEGEGKNIETCFYKNGINDDGWCDMKEGIRTLHFHNDEYDELNKDIYPNDYTISDIFEALVTIIDIAYQSNYKRNEDDFEFSISEFLDHGLFSKNVVTFLNGDEDEE